MKKKGIVFTALLMAVCMLFCAVPALAETASTTAQATMPPATVSGSVEGTVLDVEANDIIINMDNGNTISFMLNYIKETDAAAGDRVKIEYAGDVTNMPEAVTVTVLEKSTAQTITGTVMQHAADDIFIKIDSQNVFGLYLTKDTKITGVDTKILNGASVKITYTGDLHAAATATIVEILKAGKAEKASKENTVNKTLDGYVTKLSGSAFSIRTGRNKIYAFQITNITKFTGDYSMEVGARVVVTYDGYASKKPPAKIVKVIAPPDPNPTPSPNRRTVSGTVDSLYGIFLTLTNGMDFNLTYADITGDSDAIPGDKATVTYYVGDDGINYATYVVFTTVYYDPQPDPDPDPDPDPYDGGDLLAENGIAE